MPLYDHETIERVNELLQAGKGPRGIAAELRLPFSTVLELLWFMIGRYGLNPRVLYFNIEEETREKAKKLRADYPLIDLDPRNSEIVLKAIGIARDDAEEIILALRCELELTQSAYAEIATIEGSLAHVVEEELRKGFGNEWWRQGVPPKIRADCAAARELDPDPLSEEQKLGYATLIQLVEIIDKGWGIFSKVLPPSITSNKKALIDDFKDLNLLRNRIMHPVKNYTPTRGDFDLLSAIFKQFSLAYFLQKYPAIFDPKINIDLA